MEENNETLEQLRSEYNALKERLANQEIASEKLLRETMKTRVRNIRSIVNVSLVCGIFVIVMSPFVFHYNPVVKASWWFIAGTILMMAFCIVMDAREKRRVREVDAANCDLLTFSKNVKDMKNHYKNWTKWGLLLGVLWVGWLVAEVFMHSEEPRLAISMVAGIVVGLVIGGIAGYRMNVRIVEHCDEIISQIENR